MKSIRELFPLASAATVAANPQMSAPNGGKVKPKVSWVCKNGMNKTEYQYSLILEEMKKRGEILRYEFEGITLRWADMRYTPDFVVFDNIPNMGSNYPVRIIEVKGPHIHYEQQAIARFKGCRAYWPEFAFEMHQKTKSGWKRKY